MREHTANTGSAFIRLDTYMNAADSVVNVRDLQQLRLNHNMLLAKRIRKVLFSMALCDPTTPLSGLKLSSATLPLTNLGIQVFRFPVWLTPVTPRVVLNVRAAVTSGASVDLYPSITGAGESMDVETSDVITVSGGTDTLYTLAFKPSELALRERHGVFRLIMEGGMTGTDIKGSAFAVVDSGPSWVDATAVNGDMTNAIAYFPTNTRIQPRRVRWYGENYGSGGSDRVILEAPLNIRPNPATDTIAFRPSLAIRVTTMSLYEDHRQAFWTNG